MRKLLFEQQFDAHAGARAAGRWTHDNRNLAGK
jgi:hypothetical protein